MRGIYGVDVSTAVSIAQWESLRRERSASFGVVRCYQSNGRVDAHAPETVKNGWSAQLSRMDVYHFPSLAVGAAVQVQEAVGVLQASGANFATYWLDVEAGAGWNTNNRTANAAFLVNLIQAAEALGLTVGIYTSAFEWRTVMGSDCTQFARYPLWYAAYETPPNPSFRHFTPFGGWTQPARKQFVGDEIHGGVKYDGNWEPDLVAPGGG